MNAATTEIATAIGSRRAAHKATGASRETHYRGVRPKVARVAKPRLDPINKLTKAERDQLLDMLGSDRFIDTSPGAVHAILLDEGTYLASERTMYRVLEAAAGGPVCERRRQRVHPVYTRPELLATRPNEVLTWDITKLRGPVKHSWFYLYTIIDIFSRRVVGWMVAERESEYLAERLIADTIVGAGILAGESTLHADNGPSMRSRTVAQMLADLGVEKTHNRPYTSSDNPYSEAQFKTLKYHAGYPDRFATLADATAWCAGFFKWYNTEHRHSGICMLTPNDVYYGHADKRIAERQAVLTRAYDRHPERFRKAPQLKPLPKGVYINKPLTK